MHEPESERACIQLHIHADGWESWDETHAARAAGAAAPLVVASLLTRVRYERRAHIAEHLKLVLWAIGRARGVPPR